MRTMLILAAVFTASCSPCRHLATSSRDSLRVEVRTRMEYVRDTIFRDIPAQSERVTTRDTLSHLENDYALSDARINADGSLFHALATKPRREPIAYQRRVEHRDSIVWRERTVRDVLEVARPLTRWQRMQLRGFWILLTVVGFWVFRRIR